VRGNKSASISAESGDQFRGTSKSPDRVHKLLDVFRLDTQARFSALDGLPFPGPRHRFPSKDEMAAYLESHYHVAGTIPTDEDHRHLRVYVENNRPSRRTDAVLGLPCFR